MMQSDDGREELRAGTFDLDRTTQRVLEVCVLGGTDEGQPGRGERQEEEKSGRM